MTIVRDITLPLRIMIEEDSDTARCTIETENPAGPLRFTIHDLSGTPDGQSINERIIATAAGTLREALATVVAWDARNKGRCRCDAIMDEDPTRHFKGCPMRELFPTPAAVDRFAGMVPCGCAERIAQKPELLASAVHLKDCGQPIPMLLHCPMCGARHIDRGEFATKPHHTHACQRCGHTWRPAVVTTVGVDFLPGFRDEDVPEDDPREVLERLLGQIKSALSPLTVLFACIEGSERILKSLRGQKPGDS